MDLLKLKHLYNLKMVGEEYFDGFNRVVDDVKINSGSLSELSDIVKNCNLCNLSKTRHNAVFGKGNPNADIFFVGEAPGEQEDLNGEPFVGRAGELLTKIIESTLFLKREEVYISNVVKCRPPFNRVPLEEEVHSCKGFLLQEIEFVKPKIIVCLGKTAYHYLMNDDTAISKVRGKIFDFNGMKLIPTFHPSYLLRNPSKKVEVFQDMKIIRSFLL